MSRSKPCETASSASGPISDAAGHGSMIRFTRRLPQPQTTIHPNPTRRRDPSDGSCREPRQLHPRRGPTDYSMSSSKRNAADSSPTTSSTTTAAHRCRGATAPSRDRQHRETSNLSTSTSLPTPIAAHTFTYSYAGSPAPPKKPRSRPPQDARSGRPSSSRPLPSMPKVTIPSLIAISATKPWLRLRQAQRATSSSFTAKSGPICTLAGPDRMETRPRRVDTTRRRPPQVRRLVHQFGQRSRRDNNWTSHFRALPFL